MNPSPKIAWLNGRLLPYAEARLPLSDRGLLLGDSLFETIAVCNGRPFAWEAHVERLLAGIRFAHFHEAPAPGLLAEAARRVVEAETAGGATRHGALRITVTRGSGSRGYSPRNAGPCNAFVVFHAGHDLRAPHPGWRLCTSSFRLPHGDPLSPFKHGSRLLHVLARAEAEGRGVDEALLLNTHGEVAECASGNLVWFEGSDLVHAAPDSGALAGVTQGIVLQLATHEGLRVRPGSPSPSAREILVQGGGAVVLSTLGIVPVLSIDGVPCRPRNELANLAKALADRITRECEG